jgi:hypothetical protein
MKNLSDTAKNIRIISTDNKEYREFCKAKTALNRVNSKETNPDKKMYVGKWLESAINNEIQNYQRLDERRIIRWESFSPSSKVCIHYKEVDGLVLLPDSSVLIFEIKGSLSKSTIKSGIDQLNTSNKLLSRVFKNIFSILILGYCRSIDSEFGCASSEERNNLLSIHEFPICKSFEVFSGSVFGAKNCLILDSHQINNLVNKYGHPYESEDKEPY